MCLLGNVTFQKIDIQIDIGSLDIFMVVLYMRMKIYPGIVNLVCHLFNINIFIDDYMKRNYKVDIYKENLFTKCLTAAINPEPPAVVTPSAGGSKKGIWPAPEMKGMNILLPRYRYFTST